MSLLAQAKPLSKKKSQKQDKIKEIPSEKPKIKKEEIKIDPKKGFNELEEVENSKDIKNKKKSVKENNESLFKTSKCNLYDFVIDCDFFTDNHIKTKNIKTQKNTKEFLFLENDFFNDFFKIEDNSIYVPYLINENILYFMENNFFEILNKKNIIYYKDYNNPEIPELSKVERKVIFEKLDNFNNSLGSFLDEKIKNPKYYLFNFSKCTICKQYSNIYQYCPYYKE